MCMNCVPTLNSETVEEFGEKLLGVMNHAGLAFMLSIGHRTGLFDAMSELDAATSRQIADRAGLISSVLPASGSTTDAGIGNSLYAVGGAHRGQQLPEFRSAVGGCDRTHERNSLSAFGRFHRRR
jgi:hypothetical protein